MTGVRRMAADDGIAASSANGRARVTRRRRSEWLMVCWTLLQWSGDELIILRTILHSSYRGSPRSPSLVSGTWSLLCGWAPATRWLIAQRFHRLTPHTPDVRT